MVKGRRSASTSEKALCNLLLKKRAVTADAIIGVGMIACSDPLAEIWQVIRNIGESSTYSSDDFFGEVRTDEPEQVNDVHLLEPAPLCERISSRASVDRFFMAGPDEYLVIPGK